MYIRDVITVLGLEDAKPVTTPTMKRTRPTESLVELGERKTSNVQNSCGKILLYMFQERTDIM